MLRKKLIWSRSRLATALRFGLFPVLFFHSG
jgi:hypothetical protein